MLDIKIAYSVDLLRRTEVLALKYSSDGFHLAFSGGKDSQVIYELAKMAGVKFKAYFYKTSVDSRELLRFIRNNYPDVEWIKPEFTMFQLILKKKMLPTRSIRFCCDYIKERQGLNSVVILGIRKSESYRRSHRLEFTSECSHGCDKNLLSPILNWSDADVWQFLRIRGVESCSLYSRQTRIGCIGCPMSSSMLKDLLSNLNVMKAYVNTCQRVIDDNPDSKFAQNFVDGQDAVRWWTSGYTVKEYIAMRDLQFRLNF
jgi:phosphoadenosine phosphosulfate reductase